MKRLSILYISYDYYPGQGATAVYEYSQKLSELGHEVTVISASRDGEPIEEEIKEVLIRRVDVTHTKRLSMDNIKFSYKASKILNKITPEPDIVHVFAYAGCSLLKRLGKRDFPHKWIYDVRSGSIKNTLLNKVWNRISQLEQDVFDATFFIDERLADTKKGSPFFTPLGVNIKKFSPRTNREILQKFGIPEENLVFIYSGSLAKTRKLDDLIRAFYKVTQEVEDVSLLFMGEGSDEYELNQLTKKLKLSDKIHFLGFIEYEKVPIIMGACDVGISYVPMVPEYNIQPALKTLEYLSCSLPVLATKTLGNRKHLQDNENGLLSNDDPVSFSRVIKEISQNKTLREKLKENARPSILEYDWEQIIQTYLLPAYETILR